MSITNLLHAAPSRPRLTALAAVLAALLLVPAALAAQQSPVESLAGKPAPDWTLSRPDGSKVQLSKLKGEVVVLDFWATWCGPCKAAMPGINQLYKDFGSGKGKQPVRVIGVNAYERDPSNKKAAAYMKQQGFSYDLVLNGDEVAAQYGIEGIPTILLIDQKGVVRKVQVGYDTQLEANFKKLIDGLLKG
jgi:thiol-disulfide isomerase/thioredoxin